jgi:SnoaL-like domain
MPAPTETREATHRHPFTAAIVARDHAAVVDTLAPDVVLHPAVARSTFDGRETVGELYAAVIDSFEELEVVEELSSGDTHAFFWRGQIDGRFVEGADWFRLDDDGKVREIVVMGRPLSGLATFLTGIGARFARRRRGRAVATMLRLTARPLPPIFATLDPVTRWLAGPARSPRDRST